MTKIVPLVHHGETLPDHPEALLGGKGTNLARLETLGQNVPDFFVVTTAAFRQALDHAGIAARVADRLQQLNVDDNAALVAAAGEIRGWIRTAPLPAEVEAAIGQAFRTALPGADYLAVRSSAADEDAAGQSFAGMHDSFLFVRGLENVLAKVREVWASAYNERAIAYRKNASLPIDGIQVAVVVQRMIDARAAGVMFTLNPASGSPHQTMVSSLWGTGEGLVSAGFAADTFTVDKKSLEFTADLADKPEQLVLDDAAGGGLKRIAVPEADRPVASLTPEQVRAVARAGQTIERYYDRPQDVEFCFDRTGKLFILQARPVTNPAEYGPAAGNRLTWDNSNIIESYSGVTTPMTFSFIRRAYTIVYHCFAEVMGISPATVRANRSTFENMLGLIRGRVYYNLKNWYRLIHLFPGFEYNARYMESMMGLKEPLELEDPAVPVSFWRKWFVELPALVRLLVRSSFNFWRIRTLVDGFESNFREHYQRWTKLDLRRMPPHQLMALYQEMEDALLWNWKAPIINDFYVMVYFGTLKKLCETWCGDTSGGLQNELVCGEGGVESAEPAKMLLRLAKLAQDNDALGKLVREEPLEILPARIADDPHFANFDGLMRTYLDLYGFRCMNELKLEEYSLRDRPHVVYQVIRNYLRLNDPAALDVRAMEVREQQIRRDAEAKAFEALAQAPGMLPKGWIFRWILGNARLGVKNRENMRFARTRIYGLLREVIRALGAQLAEEGLLAQAEDVFYLTLDEVWDFVKGTAVTTNLRDLARLRRVEYDGFRDESIEPPDSRFDTFGMTYHRNLFKNSQAEAPAHADGKLRGIGCCPGTRTGPVKVLRSPTDDMNLSSEILVAERTDPGWVPLYPAVSGILIERGSILSHSAVVAREMGIPTIVGINGLLKTIKTGQRVTMDGRAGTIELLTDEPGPHSTSPPAPA